MFSTVGQLTIRRYTNNNANARLQETITLPIIDVAAYLMQHFTDKNIKYEIQPNYPLLTTNRIRQSNY